MADALNDALEELYAAPPERFTDVRRALATKLKAAGEAAAGAELQTRRKPCQLGSPPVRLIFFPLLGELGDIAVRDACQGHPVPRRERIQFLCSSDGQALHRTRFPSRGALADGG